MSLSILKRFFIGAILFVFAGNAKAQSGFCPPNLDFEMGDFTNWVCRAGSVAVDATTGLNTITWTSTGAPVFDRHTMIPLATAGNDTYGGFPRNCPNGSGYSIMLGNETASLTGGIGREASGISYTYTIPPTASVFSIFFYYAVVLENPTHPQEQQPRFRATIKDLTTGVPFPCVNFDFIAGAASGGFLPSPRNPAVLYKDWTPVTLDLSGLAGRTIEIEFIATECTQNGHFAYAYVDVNSNCNGAISGTTICAGDNSITLTAPFGYQSYRWFADATYATVLSTSQTLPLTPAPTVGSIFPVEVTPYPGFGCLDTLFAEISIAPKPVSEAGPDKTICKFGQTTIGGPPVSGHTYEWTPSAQVTNPIASSTTAWNIPPDPQKFYLKTTDILTGCFSVDSVMVSNYEVDTALNFAGNPSFCDYGTPGVTLSVNPSSAPIQWFESTTSIPGATAANYQPMLSGSYWAEITQGGCKDSTRAITVAVHPKPVPLFNPFGGTVCVSGNSLNFTNQSTSPDNANMTYNWKFSDGTTQQVQHAVKSFSGVGTYGVELVTTTEFGCKDSTNAVVNVLPNGSPNFTWDSICLNRPVQFKNLSNENGAASANYNWTFNDGGSGSSVKDPPPVIYTTGTTADVTLQMTTVGCETEPQSITKTVRINTAVPGIRYRDWTVPEGSTKYFHVRGDVGNIYDWKPHVQLSSYTTQYTEFTAVGNDVEYHIDITNKYTCVTTDTMLVQILKKPGFYLPTAFTPNGDGLNDIVRPYLVGMKSLKSFSVFSRWGQRVFYSTTYGQGWDGKYQGVAQNTGVYVWILEFYDANNKLVTEKGTVSIIR